MSYRDEYDALKSRADDLEQRLTQSDAALDEAHADLEALRQAGDERLAEMARQLESMRREVAEMRGASKTEASRARRPATLFIALGAVAAALVAVWGVMVAAAASESPATAQFATHRPAKPVVRKRAPAADYVPRRLETSWRARVLRTEGVDLEPGTECLLHATLQTSAVWDRPNDDRLESTAIRLRCGEQTLYEKTRVVPHIKDTSVEELPGSAEGTFRRSIALSGEWNGTRVSIDSKDGVGRVVDESKSCRGALFFSALPRSRSRSRSRSRLREDAWRAGWGYARAASSRDMRVRL